MNHLTEDQLSALADGALAAAARAEAERHLEECATCRDALAGLLALDRDLRGALEHDPGDAYFETFTARVGGRIRAAGLRGAQARAPEGRGLADWFRSPRKLAVVGAVATVVVGAGIVMLSTREVSLPVRHGSPLEERGVQVAPMTEAPVTPPAGAPVAPPAGALATRPAQPPAPALDGARPRRVGRGAPREAEPRAERLAAAPDEQQETAIRVEDAVPAPVARAVAPPPPAATNEAGALASREKGGEPAAAQETKSATTVRGGGLDEGPGTARVRQAKQTLTTAKEESADAFGGQPTFTTLHGRNARRLTTLAETMRVAPAWDSAAEEWAFVLLGTRGTPLETETRYQLARARWRAWQAGVTERRTARAAEAFASFLAMAPAGAQRDSVRAWQEAIGK
jgi:anti-sigma factor RsiW